ncbi:Rossmann-like and DUF2520 domain-containing protein [Mesonia mobilis]|uniref:DUF2520 domain-containing protein n=1 Tax=Mesonia mobilis TaxID=369791 RepID=A0ABQ3BL75_9FLAO|nr:DUF2520 domain-containing protein [Mesonia mobilis]MBQ0737047.1 DUF2520 domain-containing protein [Aquimarina celericrescens]GGZ50503.1 hypothetical protein GCM10008088_10190 [Mesonia mobilis]|tara:strand:- start:615 stop:1373 length:759 start_codon:yes stop_codon:yes gene_type:complete
MIKVVILGAGNVATHFFKAFKKAENVEVIQVYNRSEASLEVFKSNTQTTSDLAKLKKADIFLVCVKDDAIEALISKLSHLDGIVAHSSGSVPLSTSAKRNAVFYPLQTFSKQTEVNFKEIPICIETSVAKDLPVLKQLAHSISEKVFEISSEQRKKLHLAAVFACNFSNYMYSIAEDLCNQNEVPFEVLSALIKETAQKATLHSPKSVQTGPAKRNDQATIKQHLAQLNNADYKEIYKLLTQSIIQQDGKKL